MAKLSVVLPSRDEKFLVPTIHDIFRNARGEVETVVVLDSDKWPPEWKTITDQYPNLITIHNGHSIGMRSSINKGVASAISRGAKYIAKFDAHCSFSEGFDEVLKAECDKDWIIVPRRGRLDAENWCETELNKPPIDYHYLSFPNDPNDFGGPGLNGKVWAERAIARKDYELDEEMSSQGSGWFMHANYFQQLELMDEQSYGPFWNEMQEIACKAWLSGGRLMVNKKAKYLHLHKGRKYGRGYKLPESALTQGRDYTMKWPWNEAWTKQTKPFSWLIEHFWPVPTWPENWEEVLYAERKPRVISVGGVGVDDSSRTVSTVYNTAGAGLVIHSAYYGLGPYTGQNIDVTEHLRSLVKDSSLDIIVNNSTLTPDQNPFRGKKKHLEVRYSIDGGETIKRRVDEKEWLIIGPVRSRDDATGNLSPEKVEAGLRQGILEPELMQTDEGLKEVTVYVDPDSTGSVVPLRNPPRTATALNDFLVRKFQISPQRLRGPMPIELRDFHRNDLAQLFAELGFKRGAEIGVAEGHYSEILLKANPELHLLCIDPWHHYSENPQGKSKEKHEFAFNETRRRIAPFGSRATMIPRLSMEAIHKNDYDIDDNSLDMIYVDGHHSFDYCISDLIWWSKKVRSGGIISGDDLFTLDEKRWGAGPVEAVQAYVKAHRIPIWFTCDAPRSYDYFWVGP